MNNIIAAIRSLSGLRSLKPASAEDIAEAEKQLNLHFSDEFIQYLSEYGAIYSDAIELKGIAKTKGVNVVSFTNMVRDVRPNIPKNLYVISETGYNGIIVCQDENGLVYELKPNEDAVCIASSLEEYIKGRQKKSD
ncbi:MAG: SMI1/KNR4 family protein [Clostridiales bacterium]|jgi:hypothetical protein|nr:SMI1/KNR4 family protein [Clostridiales bacterium]